jgi:hypothetical protein
MSRYLPEGKQLKIQQNSLYAGEFRTGRNIKFSDMFLTITTLTPSRVNVLILITVLTRCSLHDEHKMNEYRGGSV